MCVSVMTTTRWWWAKLRNSPGVTGCWAGEAFPSSRSDKGSQGSWMIFKEKIFEKRPIEAQHAVRENLFFVCFAPLCVV